MIQRRARAAGLWLGLAWVTFACRPADRPSPNDRDRSPARPDTMTVAPGALTMVPAAPVTGWKGPGDRPFEVTLRTADPVSALARRFGTITLRTSLRTRAADLGQYRCASCHLGRATPRAH